MFCVPAEDGDEASFALISDLQVSKGPWFLAVSASSALLFRNRTDAPAPNVDGANALLKSLGPWASHALYDHLALTARTLLAAVPGCPITIPVETPHPHLTEIRKGRPASKQETDEV
ncbi:hypothetical protein C8K30_1143 [Promicromonospora sp. AC04]|nr:hypothetical protein C8K30_1143 [Promicromonospora sp. AC04]